MIHSQQALEATNYSQDLTPDEAYQIFFKDIVCFRQGFLLPINETTTQLTTSEKQLHSQLLMEELVELAVADNREEKIDAIVDSLYVLMGCFVHSGFSTLEIALKEDPTAVVAFFSFLDMANALDFDLVKAWKLVHRSNMSKLVTPQAKEATKNYYESLGVQVEFQEIPNSVMTTGYEGSCVCRCAETVFKTDKVYPKGKVLKSRAYTPVNLSGL